MTSFKLSIITPDGQVFDEDVDGLVAPGEGGSFGVLARHAPMVAAIQPGVLSVTAHDATFYFAVGGGIVEVSEGSVKALADKADHADSADEAKRSVSNAH